MNKTNANGMYEWSKEDKENLSKLCKRHTEMIEQMTRVSFPSFELNSVFVHSYQHCSTEIVKSYQLCGEVDKLIFKIKGND